MDVITAAFNSITIDELSHSGNKINFIDSVVVERNNYMYSMFNVS